ncbi:MAG: hypothetical protein HGB01_04655 [Chlorobiaceae bacterium]|nr:hypothetical protein [Chlorobiaceae bacterium]
MNDFKTAVHGYRKALEELKRKNGLRDSLLKEAGDFQKRLDELAEVVAIKREELKKAEANLSNGPAGMQAFEQARRALATAEYDLDGAKSTYTDLIRQREDEANKINLESALHDGIRVVYKPALRELLEKSKDVQLAFYLVRKGFGEKALNPHITGYALDRPAVMNETELAAAFKQMIDAVA